MAEVSSEYNDAQTAASSEGGQVSSNACKSCHMGNWIHIRYEYTEEDAITDAVYVVQKPNGGEPGGEVIIEGVLTVTDQSAHKYIHVDLGDYNGEVEVFFFDDPTEPVPFKEPAPVVDERGWLEWAADGVIAGWNATGEAISWTGDVLAGDFNEDMSTGQIITNAVVTAVPVVDQVADARDLVANGKLLIWDKRYNEIGVWVGVFACLIGLVPSLGSLAKGVIKIIWKNAAEIGRVLIYINKALHKTGMRINGYRFVKKLGDDIVGKVGFVSKKFDEFLDIMARKISIAKGLFPGTVADALRTLETVRGMARQKFAQVAEEISTRIGRGLTAFATKAHRVLPSQSIIIRRAVRAVVEAGPFLKWQKRMAREGFDEKALEAGAKQMDEVAERRIRDIRVNASRWQKELLDDPKLPPSLRSAIEADPERFTKTLKTFGSKPECRVFQPGDKIYRVVKDQDGHVGQYWSPRKPPKTEAEWRSRDAVLNKWNKGGAYIVVEVPPPSAAFIGEIGPQKIGKTGKYLEGGGTQIWLPRKGSKPAVKPSQVKEYWYTDWNAPTSAVRAARNAGKIDECDL